MKKPRPARKPKSAHERKPQVAAPDEVSRRSGDFIFDTAKDEPSPLDFVHRKMNELDPDQRG